MNQDNQNQLVFGSMSIPVSSSKRVALHFNIDIHEAQEITAQLLGHDSWERLSTAIQSEHRSSAPDEFATELEQEGRVAFQASTLGRFLPLTEPLLLSKALELRVSACDPRSDLLAFDGYRQNTLLNWQCLDEPREWRYMPSLRSYEMRDRIFDLAELWQQQRLKFGEYESQIVQIIQKQPENLAAYLYLFNAIADINLWEIASQYLNPFEKAVLDSIPDGYPMNKKVDPFNWYTIENRDFLRSVYFLASGFYVLKNYKKAKRWFLYLTRCASFELGLEKAYLEDLKQVHPCGDVHLRDFH